MRKKKQSYTHLLIGCSLILMSTYGHSTDLSELYALARQQDPILQSAESQQKAKQEGLPQARASLLPNVGITNSTTNNRNSDVAPDRFGLRTTTLTIKQPIFQPDQWLKYQQAENQVAQSNAEFSVAEQAFILRVAQGYFDNLQAKDQLHSARAQRLAFAKQLEQIEQRFKAGLISITDVHEAKAKHDNAVAEEIAAENELADQNEKIREIVGQSVGPLKPLKGELAFLAPPQDIHYWVKMAKQNNQALHAARYNVKVARTEIKTQQAGHFPSLQVVSNIARGNTTSNTLAHNTASSVGIEVSLPLFSGGLIASKTREANYNYQKANQNLEAKDREIERDIRQSYNAILTQIDQIKAFKQAVVSNNSALKATQAAFEVGNRTVVDVLDAQSSVLKAEYNYSKARYLYILSRLKLKQAAGLLTVKDLEQVNQLLSPDLSAKKG